MRIGPVFLMGFCIQKFHIKDKDVFLKDQELLKKEQELFQKQQDVLMFFHSYCITWQNTLFFFQKFQSLRKRPVHRLFG